MAKRTAADQFVEILLAAGVRRIYGVVGDSLNPVVDAVRHHDGIEWIHVRHEEAGAFAAGAEAQLTGRLVACAGSCGPGNLHLVNGLYDAHRSMAPVLALAAQIPSTEIGTGYFQETQPTLTFQECSHYCELVTRPSNAAGHPDRGPAGARPPRWESSPSPGTWPTMRPATPIWSTPIGWTNGPPPVPPMRCSMSSSAWSTRRGGSRCSAAVASPAPTTRSWPWPSGSRPRWATRCGARNGSSTTTPMTSACRGCSATAPATRRCTPATCWCCWGPTSRTCSSCRPSRRSCRSTSGVSGSGAGLGWTWGCGDVKETVRGCFRRGRPRLPGADAGSPPRAGRADAGICRGGARTPAHPSRARRRHR